MPKAGFKSITVSEKVYNEFEKRLKKYRKEHPLEFISLSQFIIRTVLDKK